MIVSLWYSKSFWKYIKFILGAFRGTLRRPSKAVFSGTFLREMVIFN